MEFGLEKFLSGAFFRRKTAEEHLNLRTRTHTQEGERLRGNPYPTSHISRAHEKEKLVWIHVTALRELVRLRRYHNSA